MPTQYRARSRAPIAILVMALVVLGLARPAAAEHDVVVVEATTSCEGYMVEIGPLLDEAQVSTYLDDELDIEVPTFGNLLITGSLDGREPSTLRVVVETHDGYVEFLENFPSPQECGWEDPDPDPDPDPPEFDIRLSCEGWSVGLSPLDDEGHLVIRVGGSVVFEGPSVGGPPAIEGSVSQENYPVEIEVDLTVYGENYEEYFLFPPYEECFPDVEPEVIPVPAQPAVDDPCGPGNAEWVVPSNDSVFNWTVDGEGNLIVTIVQENTEFPGGTMTHNFGTAPDSGEACPVEPEGSLTVLLACEAVIISTSGIQPDGAVVEILLNGVAVGEGEHQVEPGEHLVELHVDGVLVDSLAVVVEACEEPIPPRPDPVVTTTTEEGDPDCVSGTVEITTITTTTDFVFDEDLWEWVEDDPVVTTEASTRPATDEECPLPPECLGTLADPFFDEGNVVFLVPYGDVWVASYEFLPGTHWEMMEHWSELYPQTLLSSVYLDDPDCVTLPAPCAGKIDVVWGVEPPESLTWEFAIKAILRWQVLGGFLVGDEACEEPEIPEEPEVPEQPEVPEDPEDPKAPEDSDPDPKDPSETTPPPSGSGSSPNPPSGGPGDGGSNPGGGGSLPETGSGSLPMTAAAALVALLIGYVFTRKSGRMV